MMEQITFSSADGGPWQCEVELRYATQEHAPITVILTEIDPPPLPRLTEAIETVTTAIYRRHLSFVSPDQIRWIERGVDPTSPLDVAHEISLTWVADSLFKTAGYRHPRWRRLPQRRSTGDSLPRESSGSSRRDFTL